MPRYKTVADSINLPIKCPKCGEQVEKPLSWLINENVMSCPGCGHRINLKAGNNGRRIKEVAHEAARLQTALTKASGNS